MKIQSIAGYAVITKDSQASSSLYKETLGLPLQAQDDYLFTDKFPGSNHFGVWPLSMAAQTCFGSNEWPENFPEPTSTIEFEFDSPEEVKQAVEELKSAGQVFVHEVKQEPWGQTVARFMSPENVLIGFSYAPWLHDN
ncbi:VOC family protein [Thiomicrorhabdus indica]|uniref:VOC family protein n=1 Tax=Thiomicrorhabdus indica TaxID=2267253 RepID=UPI00102DC684|nr:VOC family protein [Thiomicrorhabdus indica]